MKKYFLFLFLSLLSFSSFPQEIIRTFYDPWTQTSLHEVYTVKTNTPTKHGAYKKYDQHGTLIEEFNFFDGKYHGIQKTYYSNGVAGLMDKPEDWYGKLHKTSIYNHGVAHGESRYFNYKSGTQVLLWKKYYNNGDLIKSEDFYDNGKLGAVTNYNGECKEWHGNGTLGSSYSMINGVINGLYQKWWSNGQINISTSYNMGIEHGESKVFYESGQLAVQANIDSGHIITMVEYLESGQKSVFTERTASDKFLQTVFDDKGGVMERKSAIPDGDGIISDGPNQVYYPSGKIKIESTYSRGELTGPYKEYYESGNLKSEGYYQKGYDADGKKEYDADGNLAYVMVYGDDGEEVRVSAAEIKAEKEKERKRKEEYDARVMAEMKADEHGRKKAEIVKIHKKPEPNGYVAEYTPMELSIGGPKKTIYDAYLIVEPWLMKKAITSKTYVEKSIFMDDVLNFDNSILAKSKLDNKAVEKEIKKLEDPEQIYLILK